MLNRTHEDLAAACEANVYTLEYLVRVGESAQERARQQSGGEGQQQDGLPSSSGAEASKAVAAGTDPAGKGGLLPASLETEVGNLRRSVLKSKKKTAAAGGTAKRPATEGAGQQRQAKKWGGGGGRS